MESCENFEKLLCDIRACRICEAHLPPEVSGGPRPVLQASTSARILVVGQAPGIRVHNTGLPFNDPSGDRLRDWMGIDRDTFYNPEKLAIIPMGFCYPGTGKSGDLPPRPECAAAWRDRLMAALPQIDLKLIIGQYAINWHLDGRRQLKNGPKKKNNLTETVRSWRDYIGEGLIPLPHPSPRNNLWLRKNPWFEEDVVPYIKKKVQVCLSPDNEQHLR